MSAARPLGRLVARARLDERRAVPPPFAAMPWLPPPRPRFPRTVVPASGELARVRAIGSRW